VRPIVVVIFLGLLAVGGSAQRAPQSTPARGEPSRTAKPHAPAATFDAAVKPFLAQNCYTCHGNKKHEKDLNLEVLSSAVFAEHLDRWSDVASKLKHSEMPPLEEEQPEEADRQAVATWLEGEIARIDRETPLNPGRVTARRLNRTEYNNTVRDLLGVDIKPADDFPQDDAGYGFDNIADVLSLSPVLMEKYVTAADRVARVALFGPPARKPTLTRLRSDGRRVPEVRTAPASYDVTGLSMPNAFHVMHRIPVDGEYMIRIVLGGTRPRGSEALTIGVWVDEKEVKTLTYDPQGTASFEVDRQELSGQAIETRVNLKAGDRWLAIAIARIYDGLPPRYNGPNPSRRPQTPLEFVAPPNAPPDRVEAARKRFEAAQGELAKLTLNNARINNVDIAGPYTQGSGPSAESLAKIYACGHLKGEHTATCPSRIMTSLARRAFRRPVTAKELEKYIELVRRAQKEEGSFEEGLAVGIQALLVSPDFLFRIERDRPAGNVRTVQTQVPSTRLSQHELASRLSYFLWASMPDAELRRVADSGTLRNRAVLAAQVKRMLRDPKAHALAEHFGGQWLQFRALESMTRDRDKFPDFEENLRLSMRRETELFVEHIIRDDRSIVDFLDGRYSYVNERLARHYGVANVSGPAFRRVELAGTPRGGVLTQASVLAVSSYATRTSPVLRGKWVLDNILDAPPPEPPADVPNLDEAAIGTSKSMREQLEEHRKNPTCASCHRRMDPLGFGLENFDAIGAWRTMDGKFPLDTSGTLPDGRSFKGPEELRTILTGDRDVFARALTSKLLTYALGRGLERYDQRTVRAMAARLPAQNYRFSAVVLEIVNSLPFQSRALPGPTRVPTVTSSASPQDR
jgi:mono/diheme cytochrome c family protein